MRLLMKLLAPLLGWFAYFLFRLPVGKKSRGKHTLVMKLFRYAADYGSVKALSVYGHLLFFRGEGETNKIQGAIYLERAAEKGDTKAAYQMARIYEQGYTNFTVDPAKSVSFYLQAAEGAHPLAIGRLIEIYSNGELEQAVSEVQAIFWQEKRQSIKS